MVISIATDIIDKRKAFYFPMVNVIVAYSVLWLDCDSFYHQLHVKRDRCLPRACDSKPYELSYVTHFFRTLTVIAVSPILLVHKCFQELQFYRFLCSSSNKMTQS